MRPEGTTTHQPRAQRSAALGIESQRDLTPCKGNAQPHRESRRLRREIDGISQAILCNTSSTSVRNLRSLIPGSGWALNKFYGARLRLPRADFPTGLEGIAGVPKGQPHTSPGQSAAPPWESKRAGDHTPCKGNTPPGGQPVVSPLRGFRLWASLTRGGASLAPG